VLDIISVYELIFRGETKALFHETKRLFVSKSETKEHTEIITQFFSLKQRLKQRICASDSVSRASVSVSDVSLSVSRASASGVIILLFICPNAIFSTPDSSNCFVLY